MSTTEPVDTARVRRSYGDPYVLALCAEVDRLTATLDRVRALRDRLTALNDGHVQPGYLVGMELDRILNQ